jgi:hypothetical protein
MKIIHIVAAILAILAGAVALYAPKGSPLHRRSGMIFAIAMLVMTSSAMIIAGFLRPHKLNAVAGLMTFYLVATGWLAVKRPVEQMRGLATGFMVIALMGSAYAFNLAFEIMNSASRIPPQPLFIFGIVGLIAAIGDARMLWAGSIQGGKRLARHLWRMTFAMFIATGSGFLGQAKFFPEPIRKSGVLAVPVLLVLAMLVYWLVRVRRKGKAAIAVQKQRGPDGAPVPNG